MFGTPIAGAIFGVEVLVMGRVFYDVLYPSFIAGIVAYETATHLGITYFHQSLTSLPALDEWLLLKTIVAGVTFGLTALVMIEALRASAALARAVRCPVWVRAAGGGALIALLAWLSSPRYLGLGLDTIEDAIRGAPVPTAAFLLKIVFTSISLAVGGSGGIITPVFFVGATAGHAFATLAGFDRGTFAGIGMVALLAGATNAPIAASIMAIELFGPALGPVAAIACVVSFLMVGHRSLYGSQLVGAAKSASLKLTTGVELERVPAIALDRLGYRRRVWRIVVRRARARRTRKND